MSRIKAPTGRKRWAGKGKALSRMMIAALAAGAVGVVTGAPAAAEVGPCTARTVSIADAAQIESGSSGALRFVVSTTGTCAGSVSYAAGPPRVSGTQALTPSDYAPASGRFIWLRGDTSPREVVVALVSDPVVEYDEVFSVDLTQPEGLTITDSSGVGTIVNDDELDLTVNSEPECWQQTGGDHICEQLVLISARTAFTVTARFATSDGTATGSEDYVPVSNGIVTFPPGAVLAKARVQIRTGRPGVPGEYFYLTVSQSSAGTISIPRRSITIPLL